MKKSGSAGRHIMAVLLFILFFVIVCGAFYLSWRLNNNEIKRRFGGHLIDDGGYTLGLQTTAFPSNNFRLLVGAPPVSPEEISRRRGLVFALFIEPDVNEYNFEHLRINPDKVSYKYAAVLIYSTPVPFIGRHGEAFINGANVYIDRRGNYTGNIDAIPSVSAAEYAAVEAEAERLLAMPEIQAEIALMFTKAENRWGIVCE